MSEYIPEDVLINILSRLPVKVLLQFRCVSKTWNSLIKSSSFITHHLNKNNATSKNNDLLFLRDGNRYFLYPDKDFPESNGEELDFPFKKPVNPYPGYYSYTTLVGSSHGVFCLFKVYFDCHKSKSIHMAVLWNPSIRKTVPIPGPSVTSQSHGHFEDFLGFGFDSTTQDYKLVRIVYLQTGFHYDNKETILPPLIEVYSLKSGCWRMVENDLKYVIKEGSRSAFVNGACHWTVTSRKENRRRELKVIVFFNLADEKTGEMILPDGVVSRNFKKLTVTVFDGFLSLVVLFEAQHVAPSSSIWAMKKYGDSRSWTKLFNIGHLKGSGMLYFLGFNKNGEMFSVEKDAELISYSMINKGSFKTWGTKILGSTGRSYLDSYMESLVLLDESNSASGDHSSYVAHVDKNEERERKGKKITESPELAVAENGVLFGDTSGSSATSRIVINSEGNGASKEHDFVVKNWKPKDEEEENNLESDSVNGFPGKHHSSATVENETRKAPKVLSSSGSMAGTKKGTKKKKWKCLLNFC